ncbi:GNAT family N-acetyltransferase [Hazenella sp. IB182357]|uniref:GNAT family N-acetyltransferase n=1 Tax=Polycladospora coralii TaxID=2771432 RepID=A0A926NC87_9BACL|nr:GNAT family N-acetyltransferase [Polycladospora coralii]MBD1373150.1 GNAT family N-acetyltransferase [Polycladospora coralii]MBS7531707.1 GNAT family N-acetyltransferase [Polycladospora coralii]
MRIRKATLHDARGISQVHVSSWRSTYQGIVEDSYLENMKVEERLLLWETALANPPYIIYVAENINGEVVGFACGGQERSQKYDADGEVYAIYILEPYQRQGLGRALITEVRQDLVAAQYHTMLIWVLEQNPARPFYEALGGKAVATETLQIGNRQFKEMAYVWKLN